MNRTGFFGRLASAFAVPAALALGRALPTVESVEQPAMMETRTGSVEFEVESPLYAFEHSNGSASLLRTYDEIARDLPSIESSATRVIGYVHGREFGSWLIDHARELFLR